MTNAELVLNMLAEVSATEISLERQPSGYDESAAVAKEGAEVARDARTSLEERTGKNTVSCLNAKVLVVRSVNNPSYQTATSSILYFQ